MSVRSKFLLLAWFFLIAVLSLGSLPVVIFAAQEESERPFDRIQNDTRVRMELERREGEWRKLREDSEKLTQAANELKEMVEKSNKDTLSLQILKKTEDLEKILKDIKRRAKHGF
jgi:hypothetical protein